MKCTTPKIFQKADLFSPGTIYQTLFSILQIRRNLPNSETHPDPDQGQIQIQIQDLFHGRSQGLSQRASTVKIFSYPNPTTSSQIKTLSIQLIQSTNTSQETKHSIKIYPQTQDTFNNKNPAIQDSDRTSENLSLKNEHEKYTQGNTDLLQTDQNQRINIRTTDSPIIKTVQTEFYRALQISKKARQMGQSRQTPMRPLM